MVLCIFVPKRREGSRGTNITFSVRTQGVTNALSYVVYRPGLIVRVVFSQYSNEGANTKVVRYCARRKVNSNEVFAWGVLSQTEGYCMIYSNSLPCHPW